MKKLMLMSNPGFSPLVHSVVLAGCIQDDTHQSTARAVHNSRLDGTLAFFCRPFIKWLSYISLVILIGALFLSGCTSKDSREYSGGHEKQMPQKQGSVSTKPVNKEVGQASWYGAKFHGKETANGETFNQNDMTAAHPSLPMGSIAKVTNLENGKMIDVRINDRGPFSGDRAIDLSSAAAKKIDMKKDGTAEVKIETKSIKKGSPQHSSKTKHKAIVRHHKRRK
jgi:rare lipoprotein A (peptidoglycan hydrolase)